MDIVFTREPSVDLSGVGGIAFTSSNGVRAFVKWAASHGGDGQDLFGLPVFAVGDATTATARSAGFAEVLSASGDVVALADLIGRQRAVLRARGILHIRGKAAAGDLVSQLKRKSIPAEIAKLYEARPVDSLPGSAAEVLAGDRPAGVLLYSPRTARHFGKLVLDAGLETQCAKRTAFCLSEAVAREVEMLSWRGVAVAKRPDTDHLLAKLKESDLV